VNFSSLRAFVVKIYPLHLRPRRRAMSRRARLLLWRLLIMLGYLIIVTALIALSRR
jgi:hypothetical protein